jgi:predicted acetyltransferase
VTVRPCTADDWPSILWVDQTAFSYTFEGSAADSERDVFEVERSLLAWVDGQPVGHAGAYTLELSVPGGATAPTAGVTWVGVTPTMRRRGVLTALMAAQVAQIHERGEPVAALFASEPGIYRRFGYGVATAHVSLTVPRGHGRLVPLPDPGLRARILPLAECRPYVDEVYARVRGQRAGVAARDDRWWGRSTGDPAERRAGASELRALVVDEDGGPTSARAYALYSATQDWSPGYAAGRITVRETLSADATADAVLWETVLGIDLVEEVAVRHLPLDAPLLHRLVDPRRVRPVGSDGLHVRLVDLAAALALRTYDVRWTGVVEVFDREAPWNAGRWRLDLGPDDAAVERTDAEPDLVLDIAELGGAYLGGTSLAARGRAGFVEERTDGALAGLSRALRHEPEPFATFHF